MARGLLDPHPLFSLSQAGRNNNLKLNLLGLFLNLENKKTKQKNTQMSTYKKAGNMKYILFVYLCMCECAHKSMCTHCIPVVSLCKYVVIQKPPPQVLSVTEWPPLSETELSEH